MTSERIADQIAGVAIGLILAILVAGLINWLWPEMRVPTFLAFLIYWTLNSIDTEIAQRDGRVKTSASGWKYVRPSDIENADPRTCLWGEIASIVLGVVIAFLIGGFFGLLWPTMRWIVFFAVFGLWGTVIFIGMINARRMH